MFQGSAAPKARTKPASKRGGSPPKSLSAAAEPEGAERTPLTITIDDPSAMTPGGEHMDTSSYNEDEDLFQPITIPSSLPMAGEGDT